MADNTSTILLVGSGDEPILLHQRMIKACQELPQYVVIYVNEDKLDSVNGADYDSIIYDELVDLEMIEKHRGITIPSDINVGTIGHVDWSEEAVAICPTGYELMFDKLSDLHYPTIDTKHIKPFYHKGRW